MYYYFYVLLNNFGLIRFTTEKVDIMIYRFYLKLH